MEYFGSIHTTFETQYLLLLVLRVLVVAEVQVGELVVDVYLLARHEKGDGVLRLAKKISDLLGDGHGLVVSRD